jgi:hypothetical protein
MPAELRLEKTLEVSSAANRQVMSSAFPLDLFGFEWYPFLAGGG